MDLKPSCLVHLRFGGFSPRSTATECWLVNWAQVILPILREAGPVDCRVVFFGDLSEDAAGDPDLPPSWWAFKRRRAEREGFVAKRATQILRGARSPRRRNRE